MFFPKSFVIAGGFVALSQAHITMMEPAPFPGTSSSPIDPSGGNFPCQVAPGGTAVKMEKGSKQSMSFKGSAVHGGGSCQISLTYDKAPTKDSKFKVIHSIQGGCPARNSAGNLPENPDLAGSDKYEYTIPDDIPSGEATLAWSWVNKIGNREFYMNCATVEITGSGGSESALDALPDMFTANIGNGCTTSEGVDIEFPNPGKSVENNPGASLGPPSGSCGGGAGGAGGASGNDTAAGAPAADPAAGAPAADPAAGAPAVRGRRAVRRA